MTQASAPAPDQPRSRRLTPIVGVIALVAALAGGAIAAIVTASVDKGSRAAAATVTVHDVTTVQAPNTLASTNASSSADATPASTSTGTSTRGPERTLEAIYKADAPGVVSVITTLGQGRAAQGSGIVLDTAGYILTNEHVIQGQKGVRVSFSNSDNVRARVIGSDASTDLAVLKVDLPASALHPLPLGDSSSVEVGDSVVAIGNPFGLDRTLTAGVISAIHRQISAPNHFAINDALQTDAAINHGNSGGPLIDRTRRGDRHQRAAAAATRRSTATSASASRSRSTSPRP